MQFTISKDTFVPVLAKAQSVLDRKTARQILENILINTAKNQLIVSSTDLKVSLIQTIKCKTETPGSIAVPGRKFFEIVRELPAGDLRVQLKDNGWIVISLEKATFHIPSIPAEEYPTLPQPPLEYLQIESPLFRSMLDKTLFATSSDESRPYLCGVYMRALRQDDGTRMMRMVATDGHRLSLSEQTVSGQFDPFENGVILPRKGLTEFRAIIESCESGFDFAEFEGRVFVRVENTILSLMPIDGKFPNYQQVIPAEVENKLILDKNELIDALRRVSILSDQETHTVIMDSNNGLTVLSSNSSQFGDAREELTNEYHGERIKIAFNSVYLLEAIRTLSGAKAYFSISDSLSPCLLRGSEDPHHLCVVMPMRID